MQYAITFGLEWVLGLLLGFWFTDKKKGTSLHEFKIGGTLFILFASYEIYTSEINIMFCLFLLTSGIVTFIGVMMGDAYHVRLLNKIHKAECKEDVFKVLDQFVATAQMISRQRFICHSDVEALELYYNQLAHELRMLAEKAIASHDDELVEKLNSILESCYALGGVAKMMPKSEGNLRGQFFLLSQHLHAVSTNTIKQAHEQLNRHFSVSWNTVRAAFKTINAK